jgi:hypothetical protein
MGIFNKIIESVNVFKKNNIINKTESKKQNYLHLDKFIDNSREAFNSMNFSLSKLNDASKIPNGCPKKNNEAITNQIKVLKNITLIFKKIMINISEIKNCFNVNGPIKEKEILNNDFIVVEKINLFLGSVKEDESLIGKLLYAKQEKDIKRKKYILRNQINRFKNKLNNLNEIIKRIEKIYINKK